MPLTQFCDVFGAVNEQAFNNLVLDLQRQRPSLFNYGTVSFVNNPRLLCDQSIISMLDPDVANFHNPVVKKLPLLGLPGYSGPFGLEYCLQFSKLLIDFQPSNTIQLPAGLNPPLSGQHFALQAKLCGGIGCPPMSTLLADAPTESFNQEFGDSVKIQPGNPTAPLPFRKNVLCFCLDLFVVLHVGQSGPNTHTTIALDLDNLQIPEIGPKGLEHSIECYIRSTLVMGILPGIKIAFKDMVFGVGGILSIGPTPISGNVPFNPSILDDQIEVFISLN
jgi:hypothetical protein